MHVYCFYYLYGFKGSCIRSSMKIFQFGVIRNIEGKWLRRINLNFLVIFPLKVGVLNKGKFKIFFPRPLLSTFLLWKIPFWHCCTEPHALTYTPSTQECWVSFLWVTVSNLCNLCIIQSIYKINSPCREVSWYRGIALKCSQTE